MLCGGLAMSSSVLQPGLTAIWLGRFPFGFIGPLFEKRASFLIEICGPSPRAEVALVSTLRALVTKPRIIVGRSRVGVAELIDRSPTDVFQSQTELSRRSERAASVLYTTAHCTTGIAGTERFGLGNRSANNTTCAISGRRETWSWSLLCSEARGRTS
jgi:hypothetical protein